MSYIDRNGGVTRWEYDGAGRLVKEIDPCGQGEMCIRDRYRGRLLLKAVMRRGLHRKSVFQGRFYEWANFAKAAAHR